MLDSEPVLAVVDPLSLAVGGVTVPLRFGRARGVDSEMLDCESDGVADGGLVLPGVELSEPKACRVRSTASVLRLLSEEFESPFSFCALRRVSACTLTLTRLTASS